MSNADYIHGYENIEQDRLIEQASYWRSSLILREVNYNSGESLLEIGCGAGAVLGIFGQAFFGLKLTGIDREPAQIAYAREYLAKQNIEADLKIADATHLPFADATFDHVYAMWFLEHLSNPIEVLREAYRVLKPGGTITLSETDYRTLLVSPESADYRYLVDSLSELLINAGGNPYTGPSNGLMLQKAGFVEVKNIPWTYHYFGLNNQQLKGFIDYVDGWLAPTLPQMVDILGKDRQRLQSGLEYFRSIPNHPEGASTLIVYRGLGEKGN